MELIELLVNALESTCPVEVTDSAGNHLHWQCPSCLGVVFKIKGCWPEIDEIDHRPECLLQKALKKWRDGFPAAKELPDEKTK